MGRTFFWGWRFSIIFIVLIGLTGCLGSPTSPPTVTVTLIDHQIQSSLTTFTVNKPYHFVVTNKGQTAHEFLIMPPPSKTKNLSDVELSKKALATISSLQPAETKTLDFTFNHDNVMRYSIGMDMRGFEFADHLAGHYEQGMKLSISIIPSQ
ncbi:hypothetical protein KSF_046950 [Reticulibacter mediterranei]|uniref:EfeO-type cupredoxin-like domain-containing protein n=1 Tax=Reticulibacter mediterranei TaxID=2778369 RepID=A0A8J3IPH5_9CHLR|nr:hypothetical protein [Reticulibacter mediterranei]GHO94647.1 hypothetical protein KSF_046950 [Reticulibacter mediterranei]